MTPPTLDQARAALAAECSRRDVAIVWPDSSLRVALVPIVHLALGAIGSKATLADVREGYSVALPGVPGAMLDLLSLIPSVTVAGSSVPVGALLRGFCSGLSRTSIWPSPWACRDGSTLAEVGAHELDHADVIAQGRVATAAEYLVPEARGAREAHAFGQGLVVACRTTGREPLVEVVRMRDSLSRYGLPADDLDLGLRMLDQVVRSLEAGATPLGSGGDMLAALVAAGWVP